MAEIDAYDLVMDTAMAATHLQSADVNGSECREWNLNPVSPLLHLDVRENKVMWLNLTYCHHLLHDDLFGSGTGWASANTELHT